MSKRETTLTRAEIVGDPDAEPGSRLWSVYVRGRAQDNLREIDGDAKSLADLTGLFVKHRGWESLSDSKGRRFRSYADYCAAEPPYGLGRHPDEIAALCDPDKRKAVAQQLAADESVKKSGEKGTNQHTGGCVNNTSSHGSTNASYLVRRLKRDHPEIAKALARGEYKSARAAAIAAGIQKVKTPLEQLRSWWEKAVAKERTAFLKEIG